MYPDCQVSLWLMTGSRLTRFLSETWKNPVTRVVQSQFLPSVESHTAVLCNYISGEVHVRVRLTLHHRFDAEA